MTKENYNIILKVFKDNKQLIKDHKQNLLNNATFKDLNVRLAFDVWHSTLISREVKNNIMQYGSSDELNDNHYEKIKMILNNIVHYKDFEEFEKYNNLDQEDFKERIEDNYIQEITLGTYNGALDTFTKNIINNENIINTIITDMRDIDFYNFFEDEFIEENNIKTSNDWILLYTEFFEVFTLDNSIYVMDK